MPARCVLLGAPPQVALGRKELLMKDLPPRGSFFALKSTQLSSALYPSASPSSAKSPFLSRHGTSEGHSSTPSSVIPPTRVPCVSLCCCHPGQHGGKGDMGPSGLPPTFTTFRHFFSPVLVCTVVLRPQHCGRRLLLLHSCAVHVGLQVGPRCHQTGLGAASVTQVLLVGPGCHQCDLSAASVTWVPLV